VSAVRVEGSRNNPRPGRALAGNERVDRGSRAAEIVFVGQRAFEVVQRLAGVGAQDVARGVVLVLLDRLRGELAGFSDLVEVSVELSNLEKGAAQLLKLAILNTCMMQIPATLQRLPLSARLWKVFPP